MASNPLVFALANPTPEISYGLARATRSDVILATGRSDFPNQINNVCAFPYIFRGLSFLTCSHCLNVAFGLIELTFFKERLTAERKRSMKQLNKLAPKVDTNLIFRSDCLSAIASIASSDKDKFGPDYIIPKPFDPRLKVEVSAAVAQAAMDTGIARIKLDIEQYKDLLRSERE